MRLWLVEVGRLRIGAFEPVLEHGPRLCDGQIGDVGRSMGRDPVQEIIHLTVWPSLSPREMPCGNQARELV